MWILIKRDISVEYAIQVKVGFRICFQMRSETFLNFTVEIIFHQSIFLFFCRNTYITECVKLPQTQFCLQ